MWLGLVDRPCCCAPPRRRDQPARHPQQHERVLDPRDGRPAGLVAEHVSAAYSRSRGLPTGVAAVSHGVT